MRFISLGSGSRGNATLIESATSRLLIDCGFGVKGICSRLSAIGVEPESVDALLVTHEHQDHLRGAVAFARRFDTLLGGTRGTFRGVDLKQRVRFRQIDSHAGAIHLNGFEITPYPVPHDAREPVHYVVVAEGKQLGMLTDAGCVTPHAVACLRGCDALLLECNHDGDLLREGSYPWSLKKRVAGELGHLSNEQAMELLKRLDTARLQHLVAAHLSAENNHPQRVKEALLQVDETLDNRITILEQDRSSPWFTL